MHSDTISLEITPPKGLQFYFGLSELWRYRELLFCLVGRDIKVRFKQTVLGAVWVVIQPLFSIGVFTLFFGKIAQVPSEGIPYPLFAFAGLLPWTYVANTLNRQTMSLVNSAPLITKVYFPRLIVPISSALSGLVDYALACVAFLILCAVYGKLTLALFWVIPAYTALAVLLTLGAGFWLSALNLRFRDFQHITPFATQLWMYATPIIFPLNLVPEKYRVFMMINPMVAIVEGFRSGLDGRSLSPDILVSCLLFVSAVFLSGIFCFKRFEPYFADQV